MKIGRLAVIGILAVSWTTAVGAQISSFRALIPFPFVVGSQTLPAGTYVVQRFLGKAKNPEDLGVIVMKASDHHVYKVIVTGSSEDRRAARSEGSELIFTSFKGRQYLDRVWVAGDALAHQLANVPPERAGDGVTGEVIVTGLGDSRGR